MVFWVFVSVSVYDWNINDPFSGLFIHEKKNEFTSKSTAEVTYIGERYLASTYMWPKVIKQSAEGQQCTNTSAGTGRRLK